MERPKRYENPRKTIVFIFIASLLMVVTDFAFWPMGVRTPENRGEQQENLNEKIYEHSEITDFESGGVQVEIKPAETTNDKWEIAGLPLDIPQPEPIKNNAETLAKIKQPASLNIEKNNPAAGRASVGQGEGPCGYHH